MFDFYERRKARRKITDIIAPGRAEAEAEATPDLPPPPPMAASLSYRSRRRVSAGLIAVLLIAIVVVGIESGKTIWRYTHAELTALHLFGVRPIASGVLPDASSARYPKTIAGLASYVRDLFSNANGIVGPSLRIAAEAQTVSQLMPQVLTGSHGPELIASLSRMRDAVADFNAHATEQSASANILTNLQGGWALLQGHARDAQALLENGVTWLSADKPHHVAILFGNTAEMRPGGGFVGSYAEATIDHGAVTDIAVHDINDVDRGFDANVVPPTPLQPLVRRWRSADANWFFNFPDSAQQILAFMNASHLYTDRGAQLDGVVAISPQVIQSVLSLTGPLTLKDGTQITTDNFLRTIQSDVQEGHDTGSAAPKAILAEVVPLVMQKLTDNAAHLSGVQLMTLAYGGLQDKSVVMYFTDIGLQNVIERYGWSGRLFDLPRNFTGDYVGITENNIGGAKTDIVIKNTIAVHEHILPSGLLETTVDLSRVHQGDKESAWYYKAPYQGYIQVFTPPGVDVLSANGMWDRKLQPRAYGTDFTQDALVSDIEKSTVALPQGAGLFAATEASRNVFSFWQHFNAGTTATAELDYARPLPDPVLPGTKYTFVVEKQPASTATYTVEITAPPGYVWQENSNAVYTYSSTDLPARLVIQLTLARTD
jgi:hypothetical protein